MFSQNFLEHGLRPVSTGIDFQARPEFHWRPNSGFSSGVSNESALAHPKVAPFDLYSEVHSSSELHFFWVLPFTALHNICIVAYVMEPKRRCEKTCFGL